MGGPYFDRFEAEHTPASLLLHAPGSTFSRDLAEGETVYVKPLSVVWKDRSRRRRCTPSECEADRDSSCG